MKSTISTILISLVMLSSLGLIYAPGNNDTTQGNNNSNYNPPVIVPIDPTLLSSGYVTVQFNQATAHVNDTVTIQVDAYNTGLVDWCPLQISAPPPEGLQYLSCIAPGITMQNFDLSSGIWDVYRMRHFERGQHKYIIITAKVLPSAEGKRITATARFSTMVLEGYGIHRENDMPGARPDTLTVLGKNIGPGNGTGNGTTNGTNGGSNGTIGGNTNGTNNNTSNGTSNGYKSVTIFGNDQMATIANNMSQSDNNDPLINSQKAGGGGGGGGNNKKFFDISKIPPISPKDSISYIIAIIIIVGTIIIGYYYGIKKEE